MEKSLNDAFNVVSQVCGEFNGKLQDHKNIQHALQTIKVFLEQEREEVEELNE